MIKRKADLFDVEIHEGFLQVTHTTMNEFGATTTCA